MDKKYMKMDKKYIKTTKCQKLPYYFCLNS